MANKVNIPMLQQRAAQGAQHVKRFGVPIGTALQALEKAGVKIEQHFTNQVKINDRWIGRFEHPAPHNGGRSCLALYDGDPRFMYPPKPVIRIHNEADAELFVGTIMFADKALP